MNKATIESIEWHKEQLFKLLESDDLYKEEGDIYSVKTELNEIIEKAKSKKRVWVKPTAGKKGFYREQEVGRKEGEGTISSGKKELSRLDSEIKSLSTQIDTLQEQADNLQDKPGSDKKIEALDDKMGGLSDKRSLAIDAHTKLQHKIDPKKRSKYSSR